MNECASHSPVLLVEDDEDLGASLVELLELQGFRVAWARSAIECYRYLSEMPDFHVAVVDVGLPDQSGLVVAEYIRANMATGIIVLTANDSVRLTAESYEIGVDLFLAKPVDNDVLVAAMGSVARRHDQRSGGWTQSRDGASLPAAVIRWMLDPRRRVLVSPRHVDVPLSTQEMNLLAMFAEAAGELVPRATALEQLYGRSDESAGRALDALVSRLRRKIAVACDGDNPLLTEHGVGHRFIDSLALRQNLSHSV